MLKIWVFVKGRENLNVIPKSEIVRSAEALLSNSLEILFDNLISWASLINLMQCQLQFCLLEYMHVFHCLVNVIFGFSELCFPSPVFNSGLLDQAHISSSPASLLPSQPNKGIILTHSQQLGTQPMHNGMGIYIGLGWKASSPHLCSSLKLVLQGMLPLNPKVIIYRLILHEFV